MESFWLALALFLVMEGIGPMLFPNKWKNYIQAISELPSSDPNDWRCFCGNWRGVCLVVAELVRTLVQKYK
jgi:uncharacterized protein YjeT (DUF2065 family)